MIQETTEHMEEVSQAEEVKTTEPISLNTAAPSRDEATDDSQDPVGEDKR